MDKLQILDGMAFDLFRKGFGVFEGGVGKGGDQMGVAKQEERD